MRLVVGISGATGAIYAVRLLEVLKGVKDVETHVIPTEPAFRNLRLELGYTKKDIETLCTKIYDNSDVGAEPASGSFQTHGMVVIPCSMKTLAGIACGFTNNLLLRVADVTIKEGRRMVIVPRETPLSPIHLENMLKLSRIRNVIILPAMPAFYHKPKTLDDIVNHLVGKVLDALEIKWPKELFKRWKAGL